MQTFPFQLDFLYKGIMTYLILPKAMMTLLSSYIKSTNEDAEEDAATTYVLQDTLYNYIVHKNIYLYLWLYCCRHIST